MDINHLNEISLLNDKLFFKNNYLYAEGDVIVKKDVKYLDNGLFLLNQRSLQEKENLIVKFYKKKKIEKKSALRKMYRPIWFDTKNNFDYRFSHFKEIKGLKSGYVDTKLGFYSRKMAGSFIEIYGNKFFVPKSKLNIIWLKKFERKLFFLIFKRNISFLQKKRNVNYKDKLFLNKIVSAYLKRFYKIVLLSLNNLENKKLMFFILTNVKEKILEKKICKIKKRIDINFSSLKKEKKTYTNFFFFLNKKEKINGNISIKNGNGFESNLISKKEVNQVILQKFMEKYPFLKQYRKINRFHLPIAEARKKKRNIFPKNSKFL